MKQCEEDKSPCLHAPCLEAQGAKCCRECQVVDGCTTACFKARDGR